MQTSHPYRRSGRINGLEVVVLLDTGSHYNLIKASVAICCGILTEPLDKPLYELGSVTVPSVRAVGVTRAEIAIDNVCPGRVTLLVVPDTVQQPDVIVGHEWLDSPSVAYRKVGRELHLYKAETCLDETEPTVMTVGCDADYINAVEVRGVPEHDALVLSDFAYVKRTLHPHVLSLHSAVECRHQRSTRKLPRCLPTV